MTIRTTLFPMGYSSSGSPQPQPTGDEPLLVGMAYKKAGVEQDLTPPTNYDISYTLELQSDVYRYELDMSNVANVNKCWLNVDWGVCFPDSKQSQFDSLWGCAFELYLKTPANDIQLVTRHICNGEYWNNMTWGFDFNNKYYTGHSNVQFYEIPANTSLRFEFMRELLSTETQDPVFNSLITTRVMEI